jgi:hypothetical protein
MNRGMLFLFALTLSVCATGCGHEREQARTTKSKQLSSPRLLSACPDRHVDQAGWKETTSRDGRITLRVPPGYSESRPSSTEVWFLNGGSVGYRLASRDQRWQDSLLADSTAPTRGWCQEQIDGRSALIQFTYAARATGAGYYISQRMPLEADSELLISGLMRDTLRAGVLLAIARSVRINPR